MRHWLRFLALTAFAGAYLAALAQTDSVVDYAMFCYSPAQLNIKPTDLPASFVCPEGTLLTSYLNGTPLSKVGAANKFGANHLKECDAPAWLASDGTGMHQCYDATWIQSFTAKSNPDVQAALLCRHKIADTFTYTTFDDIAMIMHNRKNGMTCWFNTEQGETAAGPPVKVDGRKVPRPDLDTTGFWLKPSETAMIYCAACHDDGPWMNSQWLYTQNSSFTNRPGNPYVTPVYHVPAAPPAPAMNIFGDWPTTNNFVTVAKGGLLEGACPGGCTNQESAAQKKLPQCAGCHKLSGMLAWPALGVNQTYSGAVQAGLPKLGWFNYTTANTALLFGAPDIPQATTLTAMDYAHTRWMPTERRPAAIAPLTAAQTYDKLYTVHFLELRTCMGTTPANRMPPCASRKVAFNAVPAGVGASVSATDMATVPPTVYQAVAMPLSATVPPTPVSVEPGTSLQLGWQADDTFEACTTEATMPAGVLVESSGGSIGTGANWTLPETPPMVGPLTEPGIYDFSIYCRDTYTASLQFQISGQPPAMLRLATLVGSQVKAVAVDSISFQQLATTTNVLINNPAELMWTGYNVVDSSCTVSGPGVTQTGSVGTATVVVTGPGDQVYTFSCMGDDGLAHSVSATLQPVTSNVCNIDGAALGKAGAPNHPGNIQLYWTDTSGGPSFPITHYNIYRSQSATFFPFQEIAGDGSNPFIAAPPVTAPTGGTIEFTDTDVDVGVPYFYQIAPAAADDTEYCSPQVTGTLTATVPTGRP